jgi:hypothetical protein
MVIPMNGTLPNDAALFQALHEAIVAHETPERRRGERHHYEHPLLVAPVEGDHMPDQSEFHHVFCHDLSLQGFSFSSPLPHEKPFLVVALGRAPFTFTLAQIVRRESEETSQGEQFSLGCRFIKRLH